MFAQGRLTRRAWLAAAAAGAALAGCAQRSAGGPAPRAGDVTVASLLFDLAPGVSLSGAGAQSFAAAAAQNPWFAQWVDAFNRWSDAQRGLGSAVVRPVAPAPGNDIAGVDADGFEQDAFGTPPRLPAYALDLDQVARGVDQPLPAILPALRQGFAGYVLGAAQFTAAGGTYALPLLWHDLCLVGNLDVLDRLGVEVPDRFLQYQDLLSFLGQVSTAAGSGIAPLEPYSTAQPAVFQALFQAAGGSVSAAAAHLDFSGANDAALRAYAEVASHCRRGSLADGTAAVAFLWAPSGRLAGQLPAKVRCKAAAVPKDPRGRVLRNLWGLRLGRATPQGSLPTAFAFLGWACRRDSLRTLSVHFGMPPATADGDPTAWQAALPTLSNAAVLADSAAPSAFLAPLLQAANVQGWLQTTVIAQWSHRTDRWSPDQAVLLRDALQAAAEQANVAPA